VPAASVCSRRAPIQSDWTPRIADDEESRLVGSLHPQAGRRRRVRDFKWRAYTRRSSVRSVFGRGFDSRRLHHYFSQFDQVLADAAATSSRVVAVSRSRLVGPRDYRVARHLRSEVRVARSRTPAAAPRASRSPEPSRSDRACARSPACAGGMSDLSQLRARLRASAILKSSITAYVTWSRRTSPSVGAVSAVSHPPAHSTHSTRRASPCSRASGRSCGSRSE
jgi:hypothetical protein